jgi:signal transduction histidine kinase
MRDIDHLLLHSTFDRGPAARYGLAVGLSVAALGLRLAIAPSDAGLPYVTFFPAATLAAIFGGFGPGMVAIMISLGLANHYFVAPLNDWPMTRRAILSGLVFFADGIVVCSAIALLHRLYRRYTLAAADISQSRHAERTARMDAERANEAKSRFLSAVSHDLRQPYQAVRLYQAALDARVTDSIGRGILGHMDAALTAGEGLLRTLSEVSALDVGLHRPQMADLDIGELFAAVTARHRLGAEAKGLKFRTRTPTGIVRADPMLLEQIIDHLVGNSIRYTENGGILLACRHRCGRLILQIYDTGIGISAEHHDLVFEEFFQVDNSERDRTKGLGLGLAVVDKAARLMDLTLTLTSCPGRGTRITVAFPH